MQAFSHRCRTTPNPADGRAVRGLAPRVVETVIETASTLRGLTILLVEQNVGVAAAVADLAHVLRDGVIAYSGPALELIGNPEVPSSYLGR